MSRLATMLALLSVLAPAIARADLEDEMGLGPEAAALGGAVTAVPTGFSSLHYAPALLAPRGMRPGLAELSIGYVYGSPQVYVRDRGTGTAVLTPPVAETSNLMIGARFDLAHGLGLEGLVGAISITTPVTSLFAYDVRPDDDVQWMTLTDGSRHLSLEVGLAYRPVDWLSIGIAGRLGLAVELFTSAAVTDVTMQPDPQMPSDQVIHVATIIGAQGRVMARMTPIASIAIMPIDELRIGLTYRMANYVDDWGWSRVQGVPGFGDIGYVHRFAHWVRPHEVALGVSGRVLPWLELSADLTWQHWSEARTENHDTAPGRFGDTFVPAAGVRVTATPGLDLLFGYSYVRAPFQNFGGPSNLLINDTHHASLGLSAALDTMLHDPSAPFTLRASFRLSILEEASEVKDYRRFADDGLWMRNPGYLGGNGYVFGGVVPSVQLSAEARW
jgi:long-subunit fatty acid transport protein